MCTPALRAIRSNFPKSYIAFLVEEEFSDLLILNPYLDEIIILNRRKYGNPIYWLGKIRQIRKKRFDLVMDFLGNPRSGYLSFLSGAKGRMGYDFPLRRFFYNMTIEGNPASRYSAAHKLEALRPLGIEGSDVKLDFFIPEEAQFFSKRFFQENGFIQNDLIVSISPTSRRHYRRWPLERYATLADWLISRFKAKVVLVWGPKEREIVEKIKDLMKEKPAISWETKNLFQLGAILRECDLHIGNDNGTKHIAVAMGKPTITIYGPQDPACWTYPDPSQHRFVKKAVNCTACEKIKHKCKELFCLDQIMLEDVQKAFLQLLGDLEKNGKKELVQKIEHLAAD